MRTFMLAALGSLICAGTAAGRQTADVAPALNRADVHFTIGWQNIRAEQPQTSYNDDWINDIFHGGAGAGWYWNDHLKTQVDIGAGTRGRQYGHRQIVVGSVTLGESFETRLQKTGVAIGQQYQFFRNEWFHPHLGVGVDVARESRTINFLPVYAFDNAGRTTRLVSAARVEKDNRVIARPFGEIGFKAYMTRRAFFTSDMRLMVRGGIDEVLFRAGFGIDF
jgi:hypothetical protein